MSGGPEMRRGRLEARVFAGRYRLVHPLGSGGMAEVYLAHDEVLDRDVAVKILLPKLVADASFLERFRREARAAAALNHPNIVAVHDTGDEEDVPFIVMELVRGRSLDALLSGDGVSRKRALEICAEVCSALEYAHARGIVHLDIKPGNILIAAGSEDSLARASGAARTEGPPARASGAARTEGPPARASGAAGTEGPPARASGAAGTEGPPARASGAARGTVKVADFGIARAAGSDTLTTASVLGTASYLSPEQARGEVVDGRSDLYSLGVVLYELTTGRVPFRGDSPLQVALRHVADTPQPPSDLTELDPALEALILKALAKDPAERHQSAHELRAELLALLGRADLPPDRTATLPAMTVPSAAGLGNLEAHFASLEAAEDARRDPAPPQGRRRSQRLSYLTVGVLALLGLAVLAMLNSAGRATVPAVVGLSEDEAWRELQSEGLTPTVAARVSSPLTPVGQVISSDPPEGTRVETGHLVALTVSTGPPALAPRPPTSAANGSKAEGDGNKEDEHKAEQARDKAEEVEDKAEEAADEAEDRAEDDRRGKDEGRR